MTDPRNTPEHWRALCPELALSEAEAILPGGTPDVRAERERERLIVDGYFMFPEVLEPTRVNAMRRAVERMKAEAIPPVFLALYDGYWETLAAFDGTARVLFGGDYGVLPNTWVWYLDPADEEAGWAPHRDEAVLDLDPSDPVQIVTFWVALTETTSENGAMYVLPTSKDAGFPGGIQMTLESFQDIRGLTVPAASVIGWHQSLLHWGGRASRWAETPRISLAWEIAREPNLKGVFPSNVLLDPCVRPPFVRRLRWVARQLIQYAEYRNVVPPRWYDWAIALLKVD